MPKLLLTPERVREIATASAPESDTFYRDDPSQGGARGLMIRKRPSGVAVFVLEYRDEGGKQHRAAIPVAVPNTLRSAEKALISARAFANEKRGAGVDVLAEKRAARLKAQTIPTVSEAWLDFESNTSKGARGEFRTWSAESRVNTARIMRTHVFPLVGNIRIDRIVRGDIERMRDTLADPTACTALVTKALRRPPRHRVGGDYVAKRAVTALGGLLGRYLLEGHQNPCAGVKTARVRERGAEVIPKPAEIARLLAVLDDMMSTGDDALSRRSGRSLIHARAAAMFKLALYCGARPGELVKARWGNVRELELGSARLVLEEHKTAKATGKPRTIGIAGPAWETLQTVRRWARGADAISGQLIFPGEKRLPTDSGLMKHIHHWNRIRQMANLRAEVVPYSLRHLFGTMLANSELPLVAVRDAMGHASVQTTNKYLKISEANSDRAAEAMASLISPKLTAV